MPAFSDNYKMLRPTIRSVVRGHLGRLPIPPDYLPDPPGLPPDWLHSNNRAIDLPVNWVIEFRLYYYLPGQR